MRLIVVALLMSIFSLHLNASCENKFFSFSIKESRGQSVTIMDIIENISDECKMTIIFEDDSVRNRLNKKLNFINVEDYSLKDLLDLMLSQNNIFYELTNNQKVLKLANFKTKTFYIDYVSFSEHKSTTSKIVKTGSSGDGSDSTTMDFVSEFKFWDKISEDVGYILHRDEDNHQIKSKVLINQEGGMLVVTGTQKQLLRVEDYITSLMSRLHKEILIEAKIIEVIYSENDSTGIDWSKFELSIGAQSDAGRSRGSSTVLPVLGVNPIPTGLTEGFVQPNYLVGYNFSMQGMINFLKTQGDVNIVSSPKVMTLNNQPAIINVGTELNYRIQTESGTDEFGNTTTSFESDSTFVGVTLDITPQVTRDNYIILKINPIISELVTEEQHQDEQGIPILAPDIKIKQLSSIVKVKNNNKVIIGGLISKQETFEDTSVPGLSSVPLLGKMFQNRSEVIKRGELIIIITPHVVDGKYNPTLDDLDVKYRKKER